MRLQFTITNPANDDASFRVDSDAEVITCGSDPAAVISLPELPKAAAEIRIGESMSMLRLDDDVDLAVNDEPVKGDLEIRNGSSLTLGPYEILVTVQFERAAYNVRNSLGVVVTLSLIVAIIVTEILVVNWLPARIASSELFGGEMLRQRTLYQMDMVRLVRISGQLARKELDPTIRQALLLYKDEADRMALHLRNNKDEMSLAELKTFAADLGVLEKQLRMLAKGRLIPPQRPLNFKALLHKELKQKEDQP